MKRTLWITLALLSGCIFSGPGNNDGELPGDDDDIVDPGTDLEKKPECEGYTNADTGEFTPVAGATTYWLGDFTLLDEGTEIMGTETWALLSNDHWTEVNPADGKDCEMIWKVIGTVDTESARPTFDYRVNLEMQIDKEASTCSANFINAHQSEWTYSVGYDVRVECEDGGSTCATTFVYASSGNDLGVGEAAGNRLTYVTKSRCAFF